MVQKIIFYTTPETEPSRTLAKRKLVEANRELIVWMEAKIKAKLAVVWGEEATYAV